jgi:hypothetical protein
METLEEDKGPVHHFKEIYTNNDNLKEECLEALKRAYAAIIKAVCLSRDINNPYMEFQLTEISIEEKPEKLGFSYSKYKNLEPLGDSTVCHRECYFLDHIYQSASRYTRSRFSISGSGLIEEVIKKLIQDLNTTDLSDTTTPGVVINFIHTQYYDLQNQKASSPIDQPLYLNKILTVIDNEGARIMQRIITMTDILLNCPEGASFYFSNADSVIGSYNSIFWYYWTRLRPQWRQKLTSFFPNINDINSITEIFSISPSTFNLLTLRNITLTNKNEILNFQKESIEILEECQKKSKTLKINRNTIKKQMESYEKTLQNNKTPSFDNLVFIIEIINQSKDFTFSLNQSPLFKKFQEIVRSLTETKPPFETDLEAQKSLSLLAFFPSLIQADSTINPEDFIRDLKEAPKSFNWNDLRKSVESFDQKPENKLTLSYLRAIATTWDVLEKTKRWQGFKSLSGAQELPPITDSKLKITETVSSEPEKMKAEHDPVKLKRYRNAQIIEKLPEPEPVEDKKPKHVSLLWNTDYAQKEKDTMTAKGQNRILSVYKTIANQLQQYILNNGWKGNIGKFIRLCNQDYVFEKLHANKLYSLGVGYNYQDIMPFYMRLYFIIEGDKKGGINLQIWDFHNHDWS